MPNRLDQPDAQIHRIMLVLLRTYTLGALLRGAYEAAHGHITLTDAPQPPTPSPKEIQ